MKKIIPLLLMIILSLSSCQPSDTSSNDATDSSSTSTNIDGTYAERIASMSDTGISITQEDKTEASNATYNPQAPLGSAARPLSLSDSEYLEILTFEQASLYGDAYLIKAGSATIAIDFGNSVNDKFSDGTTYYNSLKNTYDEYLDNGHLDLLILTHPHGDHFGGITALKNAATSVDMIVDYGYYASSAENYRRNIRDYYVGLGAEYHRIYDMVNELQNGMKRTYITSELFIDWLDTGYYQANYDAGPTVDDRNVTCLAGILAYRDFTFFFSGDLQDNPDGYEGTGGIGETSLVNINDDNETIFHPVTMMKAAHHASSKANNNILLNVIQPKIVTISAGAPPSDTDFNGKFGVCGGHPHYEALGRFLTQGFKRIVPKIYLNFVNGTTSFVTDGLSKVYMQGSPLKMSYSGSSSFGEVSATYGSVVDTYHNIRETNWAQACHGL